MLVISSFLFQYVETYETYVFDVSNGYMPALELKTGSIILNTVPDHITDKRFTMRYAISDTTEFRASLCVLSVSFKHLNTTTLNKKYKSVYHDMYIRALNQTGKLLNCSDIIRSTNQ